jgi:hypothetical protein
VHAKTYAASVATTVRVTETTRARAAAIASATGATIGEVVDRALDAYEEAEFWRKTREALASHPDALTPDPVWERSVREGLNRE